MESAVMQRFGQLSDNGLIDQTTKRHLWRSVRIESNMTQAVAAHLAYPDDDAQFAEWCQSVLLE